MVASNQSRSPINWIGGKFYSAKHIISHFPHSSEFDVYCEIFGGAAHVLMQKKPHKHIEIYNDINGDLVNFWMQCKNNAEAIEGQCRMLPYSRQLYYEYHYSLFDGTELEPLERAVRWFYVLRSNFNGHLNPTPTGWSAGVKNKSNGPVQAYHSAIDLFKQVQERFRYVMIDNRDFEQVFKLYDKPRTLFYLDPPYLDTEFYYHNEQPFVMDDHMRLARVLNLSSAYIALSYYPHPALDELYPAEKWQRITWETPKHAGKTKSMATEILLCNYHMAQQTLFDEEIA